MGEAQHVPGLVASEVSGGDPLGVLEGTPADKAGQLDL